MSGTLITLEHIRRAAVSCTLFTPTDLQSAINQLEYIQADPIRAPARAQDLILRHRVAGYKAGDLEKSYPTLEVEEDFLQNYGFIPRHFQKWLHPRSFERVLKIETETPHLITLVLEHVREHGPTHPRALEKTLGKLSVKNYWSGSSSATTRVLDALHYRGHLRVARRDAGIKVYEAAPHLEPHFENPLERTAQARELVHLLVRLYGPLSETSLGGLVSLMGYGAPHLKLELKAAFKQAVSFELDRAKLEGVSYVWIPGEKWALEPDSEVRLLAPFDPIVWDRRRFAHLFGWEYKFEAYTPQAKRKFGYYALPLLWQDRVVGYANLKLESDARDRLESDARDRLAGGELKAEFGYPLGQPKGKAFASALARELERMRVFLG